MVRLKTLIDKEDSLIQLFLERELRFLSTSQISMIDNMWQEASPYGEVRLRVEKGELRFMTQTKSYDAFKLQLPEGMRDDSKGRGR